jgi:hypothetical protein
MAKFAIYTIPPADHDLYRVGSEILGYDIRAGQNLPDVTEARSRLGDFDPVWVSRAVQYGFHLTTAGTYEYDPAALNMDTVIEACDMLLSCINPLNPMRLTQHPTEFIWQGGFTGLRYDANSAFQTLHTILCTYLPRFGVNSRSLRRLRDDTSVLGDAHHMAQRTHHFFTPYIFDDFTPHFTLLNPYTGGHPDAVREVLLNMVGHVREVEVESVCLVRLQDGAERYEIVHEFHRRDYPLPLE